MSFTFCSALFSSGSSTTSTSAPWASSSLNRPFVVGPGYSPIPEKLVTKIKTGQFIDLANPNVLDGKLLVTSSKRVQEIMDIVTWVEVFTVYS